MRCCLALALLGCCSSSPSKPMGPTRVTAAIVPATANRSVDVLFLIDDSTNSLEASTDVLRSFGAFTRVLAEQGLPDLHIGVATSDLGTTAVGDTMPGPSFGSGPGGCSGIGKAGNLQNFGNAVTGNYIEDVAGASGSRVTNYTGTLEDAFTSIAAVGANGCGFEQHLEAITKALDNNPNNAGFLRADANLAIIVVADEDDCSLEHTSLIDPSRTAEFGPFQSFRCTHFGITCDIGGETPDAMNTAGTKAECHSNEQSPYVTHVADHVAFLKSLKPDPRMEMMATIVGPPTPFAVALEPPVGSTTPIPVLVNTCNPPADALGAAPGVRLDEAATELARHALGSVCPVDQQPPLAQIAREINSMLGSPCLTRDIALPANCTATDDAGPVTDFSIVEDATMCADGQHLRLQRGGAPVGATTVECTPP